MTMPIFKCKKCGGTIQFNPGDIIGVCDTCGMKLTLPELDSANKANPLLRRVFMFLEDGDWQRADEYCEKVLDLDPENAEAYLGKLMAELHVKTREALKDQPEPFDNQSNFQKVLRFGDEEMKQQLTADVAFIKDRNESAREEERIARKKETKKLRKTYAIVTSILVACIAFLIILFSFIIPNRKYNAAVDLYYAGRYEDAITAFNALDGYKDSTMKIDEIKHSKEWLKECPLGESYVFGKYEQDNNPYNGEEDIEWIVLEKEENKVLVISKYALDLQQYNTSFSVITWETCSLRKWLNGTFLNAAFSSAEQNSITSSTVTIDIIPADSTSAGNDTVDKVFLLSITEINKYFNSDEAKKCIPTDYAIAQGVLTSDSNELSGIATYWWLRSSGYYSYQAALVGTNGSVSSELVNCDYYAVRPAMWIDLG